MTRRGLPKTRTQRTVAILRDAILDLRLEPGQRVDERFLIETFGLSRTPLREALHELEAEGLVEIEPKKGSIVKPLDVARLRQFFDASHVCAQIVGHFTNLAEPGLGDDLEVIQKAHDNSVRDLDLLAMCRVNAAFHARLVRATENEFFDKFCQQVLFHDQRVTFFVSRIEHENGDLQEDQLEAIREEHWQIVESVRRRDRDLFVGVLTPHVDRTRHRLSHFLSRHPGATFELDTQGRADGPARRVRLANS